MDPLDQDIFSGLLPWLDSDRERAAVRYELLQQRLILFFEGRRCAPAAEDLADKTLDLVARKLKAVEIRMKPESYCYRVARKVRLEYSHRPVLFPLLGDGPSVAQQSPDEDHRALYSCIDTCLEGLTAPERELVIRYYGQDRDRIHGRKLTAEGAGISRNVLGARAYRIRFKLERLVMKCLKRKRAESFRRRTHNLWMRRVPMRMNRDAGHREQLERYLLGEVWEGERSSVEKQFFNDEATFRQLCHTEADLIDRYARGSLSTYQKRLFEVRFLTSLRRRERITFARALFERVGSSCESQRK